MNGLYFSTFPTPPECPKGQSVVELISCPKTYCSSTGYCAHSDSNVGGFRPNTTSTIPPVLCKPDQAPRNIDVNNDGQIDAEDVMRIHEMYGVPGTHSEDINRDGIVNILDMAIIGHNIGKQIVPTCIE